MSNQTARENLSRLKYIPAETLASMNGNLPGDLTIARVAQLCGSRSFKIYMLTNSQMDGVDVEELNLSVRSLHCLKRANYLTIGSLVNGIDGQNDLLKIRNCGKNSAMEIMAKLFVYQYSVLPKSQEKWYMNKILEINGIQSAV